MNAFKEKLKELSKEEKSILLKTIKADGEEYNIYPLSTEQNRMWYLYNLDKTNPYYNVSFMLNIEGKLDVNILEKSLKSIMLRNKVLSSKVVVLEGESFQYISEILELKIPLYQIESSEEVVERIKENHKIAFDLEEDYPIRFQLYQKEKEKYVLSVCVHHMYVDGWSMGVFFNEFKYLYKQFCKDFFFEPEIPKLQYVDYIKSESVQDKKKEKMYWKDKLDLASFYLNLPISYPRSQNTSSEAASLQQWIYEKQEVLQMCKELRISVFSFFISIYYLMLRKCCEQDNITVGTPILNRYSEELSSVIGFFSNTIPINVQVSKKDTLISFFKKVHIAVMEGLENGTLPFNELVEMMQVKREEQINPIFQSVFSLHNDLLTGGSKEEKVGNIRVSKCALDESENVQFDLICTVIEEKNAFRLNFDYRKGLFSRDKIKEMKDIFVTILHEILEDNQQNILKIGQGIELHNDKDLKLHTEMERYREIILEGNEKIFDCHVQFMNNVCVVYYTSEYEEDNEYFVNQLKDQTCSYVTSLKLKNFPLNTQGGIDEKFLEKKSVYYLKHAVSFLEKMKKEIPHMITTIDLCRNKPVQRYYEAKVLGDFIGDDRAINGEREENRGIHVNNSELSWLQGKPLEELSYKTLSEMLLSIEEENLYKNITTINLGNIRQQFDYKELLDSAKTVACNLKACGVKINQKVVLEINKLDEFIKVFWGCILAGTTVIPLDIPKDLKYEKNSVSTVRFINILELTENPFIIADEKLEPQIAMLNCIDKNKILQSSQLLQEGKERFEAVSVCEMDIALILFTSGSTGIPKGVKLCHRNILKRSQATILVNAFHNKEISLNWMPLSHVGGIVMFHILDTINRAEQIQVETSEILQNPTKWLRLLDEFKVTNTWAPNFAYGLILEEKDRIKKMDFSLEHLKFILNGGEAINFNACNEFMKFLEHKNLNYRSMKPAWGMTETSSGVLFSHSFGEILHKNSVSVGKPIPGVNVRIVNEEGKTVPKGEIGILQISGETVHKGYYKNPEENNRTFTIDNWFDTGDFAKIVQDEVVITGRAKDIVIVNGVNISCLEIEKELEEIREIQTGTVACTSIKNEDTNADDICIFYGENDISKQDYLKEKITYQLMKNYGLNYEYLVPVKEENIPRTSIGKIDKKKLMEQLKEGRLSSIALGRGKYVPQWFFDIEYIRKEIKRQSLFHKNIVIFSNTQNEMFASRMKEEIKKNTSINVKVRLDYNEGMLQIIQSAVYITSEIVEDNFLNCIMKEMDQIRKILVENDNVVAGVKNLLILSSNPLEYNSVLEGYCASLPLEFKNINIKFISYTMEKEILNAITGELRDTENIKNKITIVKYQDGIRYIETIKKEDVVKNTINRPSFHSHKVYVVIGGLGGIGTVISKLLLTKYNCRLVIVGKTKLSESKEKEENLSLLQALGEVAYYQINTKRAGELKTLLDCIYDQYKEISGIVNLVGDEKSIIHFGTGDKYGMNHMSVKDMKKAAAPRLNAIREIDDFLLDKKNIEVIVFSSIAAFFGGQTYCVYAGISKYLYQFKLKNPENTYHVFAWSKWNNLGMSEGETIEELIAAEKSGFQIIDIKTGLYSLEGLLSRNYRKAIIGLDLNCKMLSNYREVEDSLDDLHVNIIYDLVGDIEDCADKDISMIKKKGKEKKEKHRSMIWAEKLLLEVWERVLGHGNIGINDKFFGVGGNSLKSIKLVAEINEALGCDMSIVDLFKYSTIKEIAEYVEVNHTAEQELVVIDI